MLEYNPNDEKLFQEYLKDQPAFSVPLIAWGELHCRVARHFAEWYARRKVRKLLDEALNSGDGTYKP